MTAMAIDRPVPAAVAPEILDVDETEILSEFTKIMLEWGHYKTARGLRYPELPEARLAGVGRFAGFGRARRPDGTWEPIPDGRPLFVSCQVRPVPPADC